MFFLVPRITLVLLLAFFILLGVRARRRKRFMTRPPPLSRLAATLGRRSGHRSGGRREAGSRQDQSDSFRPS